jgi:aryl-alcohol dehydrogenase-like predicted oxidoreductase
MESSNSFSDLCGHKIHRLGIGTGRLASLGAGYSTADAISLLETAVDTGVNLIDTADCYGSTDCENLLGKLLPRFQDHFLVSTKTGYPFCDFPRPLRVFNQFGKKAISYVGAKPCFNANYVRKSIEGSLRRLRRDRLDFFLLHDPTLPVWEDESLRRVIEEALAAGKIHHFGISTANRELHQIASLDPLIEFLQMPVNPGHVNPAAYYLPVMANHVFAAGLFLKEGMDLTLKIEAVARSYGKSARDILIAYAAAQPGVRCVLSGTGNSEHLKTNAKAVQLNLSNDILRSLQII